MSPGLDNAGTDVGGSGPDLEEAGDDSGVTDPAGTSGPDAGDADGGGRGGGADVSEVADAEDVEPGAESAAEADDPDEGRGTAPHNGRQTRTAGARPARTSRTRRGTESGRTSRGAEGSRTTRRPASGRKVVAAPRTGSNRREKAALAALGRMRRLALNLAVWTVIFGLLAGTAWYLDYRMKRVEQAGRNATTAATAAAEAIFSYDYRAFDESVANARDFVTGDFAREYAKTTDGLKKTVLKERAVVRARVSVASVTVADSDRVEVLLFVNQYRRNLNIEGEKVDENRVLLTMQCVTSDCGPGDWKVISAAGI